MTCAAGCWESYIVSQSLRYNADIIGDMDTPKSSKRWHVGLEWWFWRGSSYNFLTKRNQLGFRSPQRSPVPICSKATRAETMAFDDWILLAEWHRLLVRSGSWSQVAVGLLQRASRTSGAAPQASKMFSLITKESSWLTRNLDNIWLWVKTISWTVLPPMSCFLIGVDPSPYLDSYLRSAWPFEPIPN